VADLIASNARGMQQRSDGKIRATAIFCIWRPPGASQGCSRAASSAQPAASQLTESAPIAGPDQTARNPPLKPIVHTAPSSVSISAPAMASTLRSILSTSQSHQAMSRSRAMTSEVKRMRMMRAGLPATIA